MEQVPQVQARHRLLTLVADQCGLADASIEVWATHSLRLKGVREGVCIEVSVQSRKRDAPWTSVRVSCPGTPVALSLRPELSGEGIDKALGMTIDHETGDVRFDERFVVEAAPVEAVRYMLSPLVRADLLALVQSDDSPRMSLQQQVLEIGWTGEAHPASVGRGIAIALSLRAAAMEMHEGVPSQAIGPFRAAEGLQGLVDPVDRARAFAQIRSARARGVAFLGTAAAVTLAALASVLLGRLGPLVTHHLSGLLHPIV